MITPADKSALAELGKWPKRRRRRKKRGHFKAAAPLAGSAEPRKWVCRNAGQARRAALRPYFLRTRGQARGLPSGPPGNFTCSAEVNSAISAPRAAASGGWPRNAPAGAVRRPICDGALKERKQNAAHMGGILINPADRSALGELGSAAGGFEAVLREFSSQFSLIFRAFPALLFSVILFGNHKNQRVFIEPEPDGKHRLPPQTAPLVYCTSPLRRCP